MIHLTADPHLFHKNILSFCPDRAESMDSMVMTIVNRWNLTVNDDDTVYVLGDFALGKSEPTKEVIKKLKGKKILVLGNHDVRSKSWYLNAGFHAVTPEVNMTYKGVRYRLSHYPYKLSWLEYIWYWLTDRGYTRYQDKKHAKDGSFDILLHGHCHAKYGVSTETSIDVGWDGWHRLVSMDEIADDIKKIS